MGDGETRLRFDTTESDAAIERIRARAPDFTRGGARLEDKRHALTLHVRGLAPEPAAVALAAFAEAVRRECEAGAPIAALRGHGAIEARPTAIGKQHGVRDVVEYFGADAVLFVGDDVTDEDVFRAMPHEMTVVVMDPIRETAARYFLRSPRETAAMIRRLTDFRSAAKPR